MKLRLEAFRETVVLYVSDEISLNDVKVLQIGSLGLLRLNPKWILVDLSHAILADSVISRFMEIKPELSKKIKDLILIGPADNLCSHRTLLDAFNYCLINGDSEAKFLIEKLDLEQKIEELERKRSLSSHGQLANLNESERKAELASLRKEMFRLKKLQSFIINDLVRLATINRTFNESLGNNENISNTCREIFNELKLLT